MLSKVWTLGLSPGYHGLTPFNKRQGCCARSISDLPPGSTMLGMSDIRHVHAAFAFRDPYCKSQRTSCIRSQVCTRPKRRVAQQDAPYCERKMITCAFNSTPLLRSTGARFPYANFRFRYTVIERQTPGGGHFHQTGADSRALTTWRRAD